MDGLDFVLIALFLGFAAAGLGRMAALLERRRQPGLLLEHDRLVFFFLLCLVLVCLVPLRLFGRLSWPVWASNLAAAAVDGAGFLLTFRRVRKPKSGEGGGTGGVRTYVVYHQGEPLGMITREGFQQLLQAGLLKKQHTVELVDDYKERARQQGVDIQLLRNPDTGQILLKVIPPT